MCEDPDLITRFHVKKTQAWWCMLINSSLRGSDRKGPGACGHLWRSVYLVSSRPLRDLVSKIESRWCLRSPSVCHTHIYICVRAQKAYIHACTHMNSYIGEKTQGLYVWLLWLHEGVSTIWLQLFEIRHLVGPRQIGESHLIWLYLVARLSLVLHFVARSQGCRRLLNM